MTRPIRPQETRDVATASEVTSRRKAPPAANRKAVPWHGYDAELLLQAAIGSLRKFDPRVQIRNPVMFVVWLGALVTAALTIDPALFGPTTASSTYNGIVTLI